MTNEKITKTKLDETNPQTNALTIFPDLDRRVT